MLARAVVLERRSAPRRTRARPRWRAPWRAASGRRRAAPDRRGATHRRSRPPRRRGPAARAPAAAPETAWPTSAGTREPGSPASRTTAPPWTATASTVCRDSTTPPRVTSTMIGSTRRPRLGSRPGAGRGGAARHGDSSARPARPGLTREAVPELPEVEAWVPALDEPVAANRRVERAGPAHVATLKTFDPPLSRLEGRRLAGAERRGKNLLFPTDDGEPRPARAPDDAPAASATCDRREGAEDAGVPPRLRGRRPARAHGGRQEEARRRLAAHARGARRAELAHLGPDALGSTSPSSARSSRATRAACTPYSATSA